MISNKPVPSNALIPIRDDFDHDSNLTEESETYSEKHLSPKTSTDEGIMISNKPVLLNAPFSIRDSFDPDSNLTEESDLHSEKHLSPKTSTNAGIMISIKPVLRNASFSIRFNFDIFSIATDLIILFLETLFDEMFLIDEGSHNFFGIESKKGESLKSTEFGYSSRLFGDRTLL
jgi:hypothetical protein